MILVDTSVWVDHLHRTEPDLVALLDADRVATHEAVIHELALGSIAHREELLTSLGRLTRLSPLSHDEFLGFVERESLWGRGLSAIDVHLLGAARIARAPLWTRDMRLRASAEQIGVALFGA